MLLASVAIVAEVWGNGYVGNSWRGAKCEVLLSSAAECGCSRQDFILKQT